MPSKVEKIDREKQHELAMQLAQKIMSEHLSKTEEATRMLINEDIAEYLKNTRDGFERGVVVEAKTILDELTYEQMVEIVALFEDNQKYRSNRVYALEVPIRKKVFLANDDDEFYMEEDGEVYRYYIRTRFTCELGRFVYLVRFGKDENEKPEAYFYEYEFCEDDNDKLHRATDEELIEKLKAEAMLVIESKGICDDGWFD